ncbi:MAG TPA: PP2C family protein-serine/threonine phosphatase [Thermoanaerobaculia bacterium]|nr:PP2C family protein-serine/threonine phosphatase [Thermoanaerobaculia bacterium]
MKAPTLDELVLLPEPLALQRHFDGKNYRVFRWLAAVVAVFCIPGIFKSLSNGHSLAAIVYGADLLLTAVLLILRGRDFFAKSFRQILLTYLFAQILVLKLTSTLIGGDHAIAPFILSLLALLGFRLRLSEHLLVFGSFWVAAVLPLSWVGLANGSLEEGGIAAVTTMSVICLAGSSGLTQLERRRFLAIWRREHARYRERLRMREEIETARRIQLSMLPQGAPEVAWLDLAAASLPATEVGGDYYEYFRLGPESLALVIGDVAGHGLASGLLLSGVRSCLYLLEEDLASPLGVLERLNNMVRRTTDRRTYVTLLCAVLDWSDRTLTVTSAGHPPVLHYDARTKGFDEVGRGAPPLGSFLEPRYEPDRRPLAPGDVLVLYTDGLVEARNGSDSEYGDARLRRAIARAAGSRTAREVRDAILGDLSNFKGDQEQADDITVIVVRVAEPGLRR